jgi:hypothetical protein
MKKVFLPRHFLASVVLLLVLVSIYAISEGQRVRSELLRQTEAKGRALADALETGARNAILGNSLLEEQISQRLLDNARLVDQLLMSGAVDQELLKKISVMNHLQKVELLDNRGQRWEPLLPPKMPMEMRERMHAPRATGPFLRIHHSNPLCGGDIGYRPDRIKERLRISHHGYENENFGKGACLVLPSAPELFLA